MCYGKLIPTSSLIKLHELSLDSFLSRFPALIHLADERVDNTVRNMARVMGRGAPRAVDRMQHG
jgi:hypothetical protein